MVENKLPLPYDPVYDNVIPAPVFRVGDRVTFFGDKKPNKRKRGTVTQVLWEKGDKWHYTVKSRDGYGETRHFGFSDDDVGVWVFQA